MEMEGGGTPLIFVDIFIKWGQSKGGKDSSNGP